VVVVVVASTPQVHGSGVVVVVVLGSLVVVVVVVVDVVVVGATEHPLVVNSQAFREADQVHLHAPSHGCVGGGVVVVVALSP